MHKEKTRRNAATIEAAPHSDPFNVNRTEPSTWPDLPRLHDVAFLSVPNSSSSSRICFYGVRSYYIMQNSITYFTRNFNETSTIETMCGKLLDIAFEEKYTHAPPTKLINQTSSIHCYSSRSHPMEDKGL